MEYPHSIENGSGERISFLGRTEGESAERLLVENQVGPGAGPPMHIHLLQAEALTVVAGRIGYEIPGQTPREAGPGETVIFEAGIPHRFWNAGDEVLICSGWIEPAGNIEFFLGALFESTRTSGRGAPRLFDVAYLLTRYQSEFELVGLPRAVRRFVLPALRMAGRATGRYRHYADAPAPITADRRN